MLRIHMLQHRFKLADAACEEALHDSAALRAFAGSDLGREPVTDAITILKFRQLLERRQHLAFTALAMVNLHMAVRRVPAEWSVHSEPAAAARSALP
jgi:IS5 family transposase